MPVNRDVTCRASVCLPIVEEAVHRGHWLAADIMTARTAIEAGGTWARYGPDDDSQ